MAIVIDHVVEIDAMPETVWGVLTDFENYEQWNPLAVHCKTSLVPGEPIDMEVQLKPGPLRKQREFVRSCTPGVEFIYEMKPVGGGRVLRSQRAQKLEAIDGGRTRYVAHFEIRGLLSPLVVALLGKDLRRGFDGVAAGLKARAEGL
ncbi:MAG TPA: SRPBCC domain-containing protein [Marmoricola sp.]|nr:SRPBCC domain-containing protein [Marmoricola sp.]